MQRDYRSRHPGDEGCCWSICRCLGRVPCSSFCVFLTHLTVLVSFFGSLLVGFYRTRVVIEQPDLWPWFLYGCIGVAVSMLIFATAYLAVASVSATLSYATEKQNLCLRIVSCMMIAMGGILQLAWILVTVAVATPVVVLLLFFNHYNSDGPYPQKRVNLLHYGIPRQPPVLVGDELTKFYDLVQETELFICYSISLVASILITVSLSLILINTVYNYATLKSRNTSELNRPSSHLISAYSDGLKSSESVI